MGNAATGRAKLGIWQGSGNKNDQEGALAPAARLKASELRAHVDVPMDPRLR